MAIEPQRYADIQPGDQLGWLEYSISEEQLRLFREAVEFPEAAFPSIAVKEYHAVLTSKFGLLPVISAKHQDTYFCPPILGRRIQVTGWAREKYERRGRQWLVVETVAIDEIGTEIVKSRHTFLLGGVGEAGND